MTFSIKFTDMGGENDYIQYGKITRIEDRMAILVSNDDDGKKFVRIDTSNKKLSYCDAERNLILSFEKGSSATVVFSDK